MQKFKDHILFWAMLAVGLCCCLFALGRRAALEEADRKVAFAFSYQFVQTLARQSGLDEDVWLDAFSGAGIHFLIGNNTNYFEAKDAAERHGMAIARSSATAKEGDAFLLPPLDLTAASRRPVLGYDQPLGDAGVPLAVVENWSRTGVGMRQAFDEQAWDGPMVKTLYLLAEYRQNYFASGEPSNTENVIFSAVAERGMRLVIMTPLSPYSYEDPTYVTDPAEYAKLMGNLSRRLAERGITVSDEFSVLDAPRRSAPLLAGCSLLPIALAVLFLGRLLPLKKLWEYALLGLGAAVALGGSFLAPELWQKLIAFGAAVLAACWAALWLGFLAADWDTAWRRLRAPLPLRYLLALAGLLACALGGGLTIASLLAERSYMLEFYVFSGVKLAQIVPIAFSALVLFVVLFRRNRSEGRLRLPRGLVIALFAVVALALVIVLLRSGDNAIPVASLELRLRNWLELTLYARPRTKEFLLAFPALALFITASEKRVPILALPLGVLSEVGAVSVVNTFCHIFTPLRVSLVRTALGAGIGVVIGLAAMAVFALLLRVGEKRHPAPPPASIDEVK